VSSSRHLLLVLKILVSGGLLAILLRQTDTRALLSQLREMDVGWGMAALGVYGAMLVTSAWRWRLLLRAQTVNVGFARLTQSFMVATFFNNFLPSNIGGDVVRVADTAREAGSKTLATTIVLVDRVIGLAALLAIGGVAAGVATWTGTPLVGVEYMWLALVALVGGLLVVLANPDLIPRVVRLARWARAAGMQRRLDNLSDAIGRFAAQPRSLWTAFAGAIVVQMLIIGFYLCAAYSLAVPFPPYAAAVIVPVSLAVQMVPVSINGFGVREAVFAFFFASLGLDVGSALVLSLGSAGLIMLFSLGGGVMFLLRSRSGFGMPRPAEL
jgi:glycosyltransferase 2 family protein